MRPIRVRFSMGTLLVVVAVAAVNLWAFRELYKPQRWETGKATFRMPDPYVGVFPLANVALIGMIQVAARWLRSRIRGRHVEAQPTFPAMSFFCLQLFLIGWLLDLYMPDAAQFVRSEAAVVLEYAAMGWLRAIDQPREAVAWIALTCVILGVMISGPPLLLASVSRVLARRCEATLPRRRFLAMTWLVALGFAGLDLSICVMPQPFEKWVDAQLDFQIFDAESGRAIAGADVRVVEAFEELATSPPRNGHSGPDGHAMLVERFYAQGVRNAFQTVGTYSTWDKWLEVSAADYVTRRIALPEATSPVADLDSNRIRRIELMRGTTPRNSFGDIAGRYIASTGLGRRSYDIKADGRLACGSSSCIFWAEAYGYLKRMGDEFEFVDVPYPGRTLARYVGLRYRMIEWGDCRYLCSTNALDLDKFCLAALKPRWMRQPGDSYGGFLRKVDADKIPTGFPNLPPRFWIRFLMDEVNLLNAESVLRSTVDPLVGQVLHPWSEDRF